MKSITQSLLFFLAMGVFFGPACADESPNILFIAIDDLRDWVGHLGFNSQVKTPNIDRLAKRGVSFSQAHCAAPLCNPSRISLLTGIAPSRSGVYGNGEKFRDQLPNAITLMQHCRESGYDVRGCGKIFHGTAAYDSKSWDEYFVPVLTRASGRSRRDPRLPKSAWAPWGKIDMDDEDMFDGQVARWAVSELAKPHREPFFLACGFTKPHLPWVVPEKYFQPYPLQSVALPPFKSGDLSDIPAFGRKLAREVYDPSGEKNFATPGGDHANVQASGQWQTAVQAYLATISFVDAQVGRILEALESSEYAQNTVIVLWGDHGWHLGEKEHWRKHALWSVATRTPLIIAGPRGSHSTMDIAENEVCRSPVSLLDIYPTLIDLCGLPKRSGLDGCSLVDLLKNPSQIRNRPVVTTFGFNNHAVQTLRWRYIRYADGGEELYDHFRDPNEWKNLAIGSQHSARIMEMKSHLPKRNRR